MKKIIIVFFILISIPAFSQNNVEMWYKLSPEIRLNFEDSPWEFRWRPDDHIFLPGFNVARTDIMIGANIWKFKIFSYSKFDALKGYWTGVRFDFNTDFFNKRLLINIQERFFFGLNQNSENHYYLIQYVRYAVTKNIHTGVLMYGKWNIIEPFNEGHWFIGPSVYFGLPYNFNLHLVVTKDIHYREVYMTYIRLGFKIKWKKKKIE